MDFCGLSATTYSNKPAFPDFTVSFQIRSSNKIFANVKSKTAQFPKMQGIGREN